MKHLLLAIPLFVPDYAYDPDPKNAYKCVIEAPIPLASTATGLPDLSGSGWEYRTFILQDSDDLPGSGFLRAKITQP